MNTAKYEYRHNSDGVSDNANTTVWRHVRSGGSYVFICEGLIESAIRPAVVYRSVESGIVRIISKAEFYDGRFVQMPISEGY